MVGKLRKLAKSQCIFLLLIIFLGLILRLYKINNPVADWHSFRQADTASVGRLYVENGIDLLEPRYHDISTTQSGTFNPEGYRFVEFPLFSLFHSEFYKLYSSIDFDVWGRFVSIFSAAISTYLIFLLGKKYIGFVGGLLASLFYAVLPFNVYFTRVILPEPLAVTLGLAGLWFFVRYIDTEKYTHLIAYSLFFSLAILVKPYIIFYTIPALYLSIKKYGFKGALLNKKLIISCLIVIMPFILWRSWMRQFPEGIPFWKWTFNGDGIRFRPSFWRWIFGERLTKLILGYWGLIPFVFGILGYKKGKHFIHFFLLGSFVYVSIIATANVRHDYYQTIIIPSVALTFAQGVYYMWTMKERAILVRSILIFSVLIMLVSSASEIKEFYKINHPEIIEAGQAVQRIIPKDALIIAPYNGDTAFLYQTQRRGWPVVDRPINELIHEGAEYFVSVDLNHPQTVEFSEKFVTLEKTDSYTILDLSKEKKG